MPFMKKQQNSKINKIKQGAKNRRFGFIGELMVIFWLSMKMYKIIAWRHKNFIGEIDLVLEKKNQLIFVEIKSKSSKFNRENYDHFSMISEFQLQKIRKAAEVFLVSRQKQFANHDLRFDVVVYQPFFSFTHLINCF